MATPLLVRDNLLPAQHKKQKKTRIRKKRTLAITALNDISSKPVYVHHTSLEMVEHVYV